MTMKPSDNLITLIEPDSAAAEAFRILRTNISLKDFDSKLKVINVISASAQESKSTTVLNLGYVFSQLGKKILIMDLDLRLPSIHKKLRLKNKNGVTDVISKSVSFEEAVIHYTSNMDVLLSGTRNPYASEFIQSAAFTKLLNSLKERYDMIFMDAAKGQYPGFLPYVMRLLLPGGILVSDNVLQDGSIADSRYAIERRDRTIHTRMRDYLWKLTHDKQLTTSVLQVGDGVAVSVKAGEM